MLLSLIGWIVLGIVMSVAQIKHVADAERKLRPIPCRA